MAEFTPVQRVFLLMDDEGVVGVYEDQTDAVNEMNEMLENAGWDGRSVAFQQRWWIDERMVIPHGYK